MSETIEVPPFVAAVEEGNIVFRFDPEALEQGFEYPPNMEALVTNTVAGHREQFADRQVVIDLENLPAISSKQLGAMLAIRKAFADRGRIHIANLRPNVRELLTITKLSDFFTWDA